MLRVVQIASVAVLALGLGANLGRIEGTVWPVTDETAITKVEVLEYGQSRIWGEFRKLRDCRFEGLTFYLTSAGGGSAADLVFEGGTKVRDSGFETFGPWRVQLTAEQLRERSRAEVRHVCPMFAIGGRSVYRPWQTVTQFYP